MQMSYYINYNLPQEVDIMNYEIVELKEKIVEGIGVRTNNQNGKSIGDIGGVWQRFFTDGEYAKIENKVNNKTIGLYTDYDGDYTCDYYFLAGSEVKEKSNDMENRVCKVIPGGKYAKFVIIGDVQKSVGEAWQEIWNMDLDRKYTCDFEEYQNNTEDMQRQEIHVYVAIRQERLLVNMEKIDYKKEYKDLYLPKTKAMLINVPNMKFIMVEGSGNPNDENGEYKKSLELLYGLSFAIKMSIIYTIFTILPP